MTRHFCKLILLLILLVLLDGCRDRAGQAWAPGLEETGYSYLADTTDRALDHLQQAAGADAEARSEAIEQARQQLLALQRYFIPLTEVRQQLYDADRLDFNGELTRAGEHLKLARQKLLEIAEQNSTGVRDKLLDLVDECDKLLHQLDLDGQPHKNAFDALVHEVNLLLTRGELVLAGSHFS